MLRIPSPFGSDIVLRSPSARFSFSPSTSSHLDCPSPLLNVGDVMEQPLLASRWNSDCSLPRSQPALQPIESAEGSFIDLSSSLPPVVVAVAIQESDEADSKVRQRAIHKRRRERERCAMETLAALVEGGVGRRKMKPSRSGCSRNKKLDRLSLIEAAGKLLEERNQAYQSALIELSERFAKISRGVAGWVDDGLVSLCCTTADTGQVCAFDSLYAGTLLSLGATLGNWSDIKLKLEEAHARGDIDPELSLERVEKRVIGHVTGSQGDPRLCKFISPLYPLLRGTVSSSRLAFSAFQGGRWVDKIALVWIASRSRQSKQRSLTAGCLLAFACRPDAAVGPTSEDSQPV